MNQNQLTHGNITKGLTGLAIPIMGTSFLQMAYNMVDMMWIGKLGSDSVAAVGTAGYFMWLSFSLIVLARVGTEVNIAQAVGGEEYKKANIFAKTSILFTVFLGISYGLFLILFNGTLIGFFKLGDMYVEGLGRDYLSIVGFGMVFSFLNPLISGFYNGAGNSRTPFQINSVGLVFNMVLDPVLIFTFGLGVKGAAYATVGSQFIVAMLFVVLLFTDKKPYRGFDLKSKASMATLKSIVKISLPVSLQNGLFTIFAMFIARIIAVHGTTAIAVQKVGTQIEAISYMTAQGFGAALSAFVGQNLGANKIDRVKDGFKVAGVLIGIIGVLTSCILFFAAEPIFKIFIDEEPALSMGVTYLRILSFSQFFMCVEIAMAGGFNGLGKSTPPAVISIIFNALRIPSAYFLSTYTILKLNGIWWSISVTTVFKGTILVFVLLIVLRKLKPTTAEN